jgi:acetylornithine deacetylase
MIAAAGLLAGRWAHGRLIVAAVADEEHLSLGAEALVRTWRADMAVVTEPTDLRLAIGHKGFAWLEVEVSGRAAHGSRPQLGVDAIVKAGPILTALGDLDARLGDTRHPLLGRGSVHASLISGGSDLATYPERCTIGIERRTLPGEGTAEVERELARLLAGCRDADSVLEASARTLLVREPLETADDEPVVAALREAAAEVLGSRPPLSGASYWADSAFIAGAGIPTALFGPGGAGAHAAEEWVSIRDTESCARVLTKTASAFCG